jgi:hypothetical protein
MKSNVKQALEVLNNEFETNSVMSKITERIEAVKADMIEDINDTGFFDEYETEIELSDFLADKFIDRDILFRQAVLSVTYGNIGAFELYEAEKIIMDVNEVMEIYINAYKEIKSLNHFIN